MHCLNKHKEKCSDETKSKHSMHCKTSNDSCCCDIVDSKWHSNKKSFRNICNDFCYFSFLQILWLHGYRNIRKCKQFIFNAYLIYIKKEFCPNVTLESCEISII